MSFNGGGSIHKRPLDNTPYQGSGGYQGGSADIKRSRPEMAAGGGGGGNNLSMYGPPGGNGGSRNMPPPTGSSTGNHPRRPGLDVCMHFRRTGNCKFGTNCRYDHPVDGLSSPSQKTDFRGGPGDGRGAASRNSNSNGPPPHSPQQQQEAPGIYHNQQHGLAQQSPPQPFNQQPPQQQPQQLPHQHGPQASQQGDTGPYAQGQGTNSSGTASTPGTGSYDGNAYPGGYASNPVGTPVMQSPSTPRAQVPAPGAAYGSSFLTPSTSNPPGYGMSSSTQGNMSSAQGGASAAGDSYVSSLDVAGSVTPGQTPPYANPPLTQPTSVYGSSSTQQSGSTLGTTASASASATTSTNTGGWIYDRATDGYKMTLTQIDTAPGTAPAAGAPEATGSSTNGSSQQGYQSSQQQQHQQRGGCAAGTPGGRQPNSNVNAGAYVAPSRNPYGSSAPTSSTPGYPVAPAGTPSVQGAGTGTASGASSSATQGTPYGQTQSPAPSSSFDVSGQTTFGVPKSVGGSGTTGGNGAGPTSGDGGYVAANTASGAYGAPGTGYGASSSSAAGQPNFGTAVQPQPAPGSQPTNFGSTPQQSGFQSVTATSAYGTISSAGGSTGGVYGTSSGYSAPSSYGPQSQESSSGSQHPQQQQSGVYPLSGSGSAAPSAAYGNTLSATNTSSRGKNASGNTAGSNNNSGAVGLPSSSANAGGSDARAVSSAGSVAASGSGAGSDASDGGGSRGPSGANRAQRTGGSGGATSGSGARSSGSSSSNSGAAGSKESLASSGVAYATHHGPATSGPQGRKDAPQGTASATLASAGTGAPPGSMYPQQSPTSSVAGAVGFLAQGAATGGVVGYGLPPSGVQYAVTTTVTGANGAQQQHYAQPQASRVPAPSNLYGAPASQPQQQPQQQLLPQPQQPIIQQPMAVAGQYVMAPQGQATPHLQHLPQGQQPQQQSWQQQPQQQPLQQPQPLQQSLPPGQPGVGQPPSQGAYPGYTAGMSGPGIPAPASQQQPAYNNPAIAPFGQPIQQQPPQQQPLSQQGPGGLGTPGGGFSSAAGPTGVFQPNGQGHPPQGVSAGNPIFSHPGPGNGNMPPQIMGNPPAGNLPPQGMMPSPGERGGGREGRGRDGRDGRDGREGREGNKYTPSNPAPNMPQRSSQPECNHFVKTGFCRYGTTCKYHHPYHRVGQQAGVEASGSPRKSNVVQTQDRAPCDVYLNTGVCTFGEKCRFRHITRGQLAMESAQGVTHPDPNQLPHRAGLPPCGFYTRTGKCAFGMKCKFDHPEHRNPNNSNLPGGGSSGFGQGSGRLGGLSGVTSQQPSAGPGHTGRVAPPNASPMKSEPKGGPTEVTARHILIKHKGSRRPASWQDPSGVEIKQRTQSQATAVLQSLRTGIKSEDDFAKVAMAKSDCSSAKRGGDLSSFGRGKMQRAFEDAAFGLEIGGVSEVVATDSGVHLIMRTA